MSDTPDPTLLADLQTTVSALRAELDAMKTQLKDICRAVRVETVDGYRRVTLRCTDLVVRTRGADPQQAIRMGTGDGRGWLSFYHTEEGKGDVALSLSINEEDQPAVRLLGADKMDRVLLGVEQDHGVAVFFAPDGEPGAVARAQPGGGSFAVLQPDGKVRGMLVHAGGHHRPDGAAATELLFASGNAETLVKLRADAGGGIVALGEPGRPNAAMLVARGGSGSLTVRSADNATTAAVVASPDLARIMTFTGSDPALRNDASLTSSEEHGTSMVLRRADGSCGVEATVTGTLAQFSLQDAAEQNAVCLSHGGDMNSLTLHTPGSAAKVLTLGATEATAFSRLCSPANEQMQLFSSASAGTIMHAVMDGEMPLAAMSNSEHGGGVVAYGLGENPTYAALTGQPASAAMIIATADGTTLAGMSATDHGGHLTINNDIGFPRAMIGLYEESSGLTLNHTGQHGISLIASPAGGVVTVFDKDGRRRAMLPDLFEDKEEEQDGEED